jgi:hypothetical protein
LEHTLSNICEGRIYPQQVLLGGRLSTQATIESTQTAEKQKQLDTFAASLQTTINVPLVVQGSLSVTGELQNRSELAGSQSGLKKITSWNSYGGDDLLITEYV